MTRGRVIEEAARLADEAGLDAVSLAAVARRVGVRQPSLYKHVESLAALQHGVAALAVHEYGEVLTRAAVGRSGSEAVRSMAAACRQWARAHPARYAASQHPPAPGDLEHDAAAITAIQPIADVLERSGLAGDDAVDAIRAFRAALHGFITLEAQGSFRFQADVGRSFDRLIGALVAGLHLDAVRTKHPR